MIQLYQALRTMPKAFCKGNCTHMFISTWFLATKLWNQLRCPSTDRWRNTNTGYIYIGVLFINVHIETMQFSGKYMELDIVYHKLNKPISRRQLSQVLCHNMDPLFIYIHSGRHTFTHTYVHTHIHTCIFTLSHT